MNHNYTPGRSLSMNSQCSMIYLSLVLPTQLSDIKHVVPRGIIAMRLLAILWCLEIDQHSALEHLLEGLSIKTLKQSIITLIVLPKASLKQDGIVACSVSQLSGQCTKGLNMKYITCKHVLKCLPTV